MTAKTLAERSASYRQRKAERLARMERLVKQMAATDGGTMSYDYAEARAIAALLK